MPWRLGHSVFSCPCEQTSLLWRDNDYVIDLKHLGREPLATILQARRIPCSGIQERGSVLLCCSSSVSVSTSLWDSDRKEQQVQSLRTDQNPDAGIGTVVASKRNEAQNVYKALLIISASLFGKQSKSSKQTSCRFHFSVQSYYCLAYVRITFRLASQEERSCRS